ncbi:hypothetical protein HID58_085886 [Brassica napus]|uniref:pantothenate kinase n=1 Tax=Brassica napus TaxID=3708 RepID=A0A816IYF9_BRANA|nr:hypothetical protein HID58_085886 [Brassica napus]CAF1724938.1 unnamed protein product [Brassica napus]
MDPKNSRFSTQISHLALDIGGTLIKLVYFSPNGDNCEGGSIVVGNGCSVVQGRLCFAKFETRKIDDCLDFIRFNILQHSGVQHTNGTARDKLSVKATGGGAFKFADLFKEKLGIVFDKEDEMHSLVCGVNFLLKTVPREAFTYLDGQKEFVQIDHNDLYPYLLVNIGSGVSMIKVDGDGKYERISGTSLGGGTFLGLGKLLTNCKSFDELLELSHQGNNRVIDMLVGDIYGGTDYSKIGLSSTAIASSFGKAISDGKELEDYQPEDVARSLLRMISNNIGQIAYLNALRFGLKRIFFGGFFIRGLEYTMDTISVAVHFWSRGEAKAMFLRHEGFLGALGAFTSYKDQSHSTELKPHHHTVERAVLKCSDDDSFRHTPVTANVNDGEAIEFRRLETTVATSPRILHRNQVYHSSFVEEEGITKACGCPLLPLKSHIKGPAPVSEQDRTDIVDEAITFFRANVFFTNFPIKSPADKLLIYLTFYINVALKRLEGCRTLAVGTKAIINLGLEDIPVPGETGFPFPGLFSLPSSQEEADLFRNYLKQVREETSGRLLSVAYRANGTPNKWWLAFAKRKFINVVLL